MKKFLSALCAACLLVCSLTFTAPSAKAAGDSLDIVLTNASGVVNDEITVEMNITQNPGMYAFWFFLYYDSDAFILKDVKVNEALKSEGDLYDTENAATSDSVKGLIAKRVINYFGSYGVDSAGKNLKILFFEGKSIYENTDYVGNVATFTFQIMGIADDGEYEIGLIPDPSSIINNDSDVLPVTWKNSIVAVGNTTPPNVPSDDENPPKEPDDTVAPLPEDGETTSSGSSGSTGSSGSSGSSNQSGGSQSGSTQTPPESYVDAEGTTYYKGEDGTDYFIGDDGNSYYVDSEGDTQVYEREPESDVGNEKNENNQNSQNNGSNQNNESGQDTSENGSGKKSMKFFYMLIGIIAAVHLLAAAAVVLIIFIRRTKNDDGSAAAQNIINKKAKSSGRDGSADSDTSNDSSDSFNNNDNNDSNY